jgi:hypothetical protein
MKVGFMRDLRASGATNTHTAVHADLNALCIVLCKPSATSACV